MTQTIDQPRRPMAAATSANAPTDGGIPDDDATEQVTQRTSIVVSDTQAQHHDARAIASTSRTRRVIGWLSLVLWDVAFDGDPIDTLRMPRIIYETEQRALARRYFRLRKSRHLVWQPVESLLTSWRSLESDESKRRLAAARDVLTQQTIVDLRSRRTSGSFFILEFLPMIGLALLILFAAATTGGSSATLLLVAIFMGYSVFFMAPHLPTLERRPPIVTKVLIPAPLAGLCVVGGRHLFRTFDEPGYISTRGNFDALFAYAHQSMPAVLSIIGASFGTAYVIYFIMALPELLRSIAHQVERSRNPEASAAYELLVASAAVQGERSSSADNRRKAIWHITESSRYIRTGFANRHRSLQRVQYESYKRFAQQLASTLDQMALSVACGRGLADGSLSTRLEAAAVALARGCPADIELILTEAVSTRELVTRMIGNVRGIFVGFVPLGALLIANKLGLSLSDEGQNIALGASLAWGFVALMTTIDPKFSARLDFVQNIMAMLRRKE